MIKRIKATLKNIFLGKMHEKTLNVEVATAFCLVEGGRIHRITREGYVQFCLGDLFAITGSCLLKRYLADSKRLILEDDDGNLFPVHRIHSIELEVRPKHVTEEWRW